MPFMLDEPKSSETQLNGTQADPSNNQSNHQSNEAQPDQSNTQTNETQSDPAITDLYDRIVRSEQRIGVMIDITSFDHLKIRNIVDDKFIDTTEAAPEHHAALKRRIKALLSGQSEGEKILWDFHELTLHTQPSLTPNAPSRARSICCLASELDITSDKECECGCGEKDHDCDVHGKRFRVLFFIDNEPFQLDRRIAFRSEVTPEGLVTLDRKPDFEDLRAWDRALEKADRFDWGRFCWKVLWERVAASLEEAFEARLRGDRDEWVENPW